MIATFANVKLNQVYVHAGTKVSLILELMEVETMTAVSHGSSSALAVPQAIALDK